MFLHTDKEPIVIPVAAALMSGSTWVSGLYQALMASQMVELDSPWEMGYASQLSGAAHHPQHKCTNMTTKTGMHIE